MPIYGSPVYAHGRPGDQHGRQRKAQLALLRGSTALAALAAIVVSVVAGTGWLYMLRDLHFPASGPRLDGALPLQQLAGGATQPLSRMLVAWLPAGLALGVTLAALTRIPRPLRVALVVPVAAALLLVANAVSDAITQNNTVNQHIWSSLDRSGIWLAVALLALGTLIAPPWWARRSGAAAGASRR